MITLQIWVTHTYNWDLTIVLYGPDGSYITLSNKRGGNNANVFNGTLFTDSASNSVSTYSFWNNVIAGPLKPEEPFSSFRGKYPNGKWKLWINDAAISDDGRLYGSILNIQGFFFYFFKKKIKLKIFDFNKNNTKRWMFEWKSVWRWRMYFNKCKNFYM